MFAMPRLVLQAQARHRVNNIQAALPDGLDMLNMCMTGGLSLQMAFERVSGEIRSSHRDLATEFDIIRRHSETHTMERALEMFAERIDTPEVKSLAAVTSQSVRLGSNVGTALQEYADSMRTGQRQRAEERGNRRSVAMLFPVALCLAPPVYILLLGPAVLELRDFALAREPVGWRAVAGHRTPATGCHGAADRRRRRRPRPPTPPIRRPVRADDATNIDVARQQAGRLIRRRRRRRRWKCLAGSVVLLLRLLGNEWSAVRSRRHVLSRSERRILSSAFCPGLAFSRVRSRPRFH